MAHVEFDIDAKTPVNVVVGLLKVVTLPLKVVNNVILDATDAALIQRRIERIEQLQAEAEKQMAEAVAAETTEQAPAKKRNAKGQFVAQGA